MLKRRVPGLAVGVVPQGGPRAALVTGWVNVVLGFYFTFGASTWSVGPLAIAGLSTLPFASESDMGAPAPNSSEVDVTDLRWSGRDLVARIWPCGGTSMVSSRSVANETFISLIYALMSCNAGRCCFLRSINM